jgi:hypothetical protein
MNKKTEQTKRWIPKKSDLDALMASLNERLPATQVPAVAAALRYLRRKLRYEHPKGSFDKSGRWFPADSESLDTNRYRPPSRRWPYSYMTASRTAFHCTALERALDEVKLVRGLSRIILCSTSLDDALIKAHRRLAKVSRRRKRKPVDDAKKPDTPETHSSEGSP